MMGGKNKRFAGILLVGLLVFAGKSAAASGQVSNSAMIEPDSFQTSLEQVTSRSRQAGTAGERESAKEIAQTLRGYGYEVTEQSFTFTEELSGAQDSDQAVNVVAVKAADKSPNGDILIVSAHHDSKECTVGANDNGSGTALLLELAEALKDDPTDTEIRFIFFSAEEEGLKGSRYYVSQLSEEEREHIVGDIQIDMIGHYLIDQVRVSTVSGDGNLLQELLLQAAGEAVGREADGTEKETTGTAWIAGTETSSDHASFAFAGIPSVLVMQDGLGSENHKFSDRPEIIDASRAAETGNIILSVLRDIMSEETPGLCESSRESDSGNSIHNVTDRTPILFGAQKDDVEIKFGASGVFEKEEYDGELDWYYEHYIVSARWFGWAEEIPTDFVYRRMDDGSLYLENVYLRTEEAGLGEDELKQRMDTYFGSGVNAADDDAADGGTFLWGADNVAENLVLRQFLLVRQDGKTALQVVPLFHSALGEDLQTVDFDSPREEYETVGDAADAAVFETLHKIIPSDDPYIARLVSWTDGYSYILGTCGAQDEMTSDSFDIRIDRYDFFDENGNCTDVYKMLATMVHEYGHALTLNADQIEVSALEEGFSYNDISLYKEDSYMKAYYDRFYDGEAYREYAFYPEDYVDEYAGGSGIYEDIAETFMVFVTGSEPEEASVAAEKIRFFYEYPELVKIRQYIRNNFGYPEEKEN